MGWAKGVDVGRGGHGAGGGRKWKRSTERLKGEAIPFTKGPRPGPMGRPRSGGQTLGEKPACLHAASEPVWKRGKGWEAGLEWEGRAPALVS